MTRLNRFKEIIPPKHAVRNHNIDAKIISSFGAWIILTLFIESVIRFIRINYGGLI